MTGLSRSQIDRLGDRIRACQRISDQDLAQLQAVREVHDEAMAAVTVALREIEVDGVKLAPTSRLKTVGTIVEKLQRESTRLGQMQDIAGVRIVIDGNRLAQDRTVEAIKGRFPASQVRDRRTNPSHGYRAVHVMVRHGACRVEVQVRTRYQDGWAQLVERMGDLWGRQVRYGEPPDDPAVEVSEGVTRAGVMNVVASLADIIESAEEAAVFLEERETTVALDELDEEAQAQLEEAAERASNILRIFRQTLEPLILWLPDAPTGQEGPR